jgi:hypothetical protein
LPCVKLDLRSRTHLAAWVTQHVDSGR